MTLAEQKAGQDTVKDLVETSLTQDDSPPQTVYRTLIEKGASVFLDILLEYRQN